MDRLNHPVYRNRLLQIALDAGLAALAWFLAFQLRFIDLPNGIPGRYEEILMGSIVFVALGKTIVFSLLGLHQKWWRYFALRDFGVVIRAAAVATAILIAVFVIAQPFADDLPRSVVVLDFILTVGLVGSARAAIRFWVEHPDRQTRRRQGHDILVVGAGWGGQMVIRELQLNPGLGGRAIGFIDDDPRKRGMQMQGVKVLGTTDEISAGDRADEAGRGRDRDSLRPRLRCAALSSPPVASTRSRCGRCRPSSSSCEAASSSPASSARSRSRTCSAASRW